jgi:hypothetical protein
MKVELRKGEQKKDRCLVIDGVPIEDSLFHELGATRFGHIYDIEAASRLAKYRFEDFEPHFEKLSLWFNFEWNELLGEVEIEFGDENRKVRILRFELRADWEDWARPYSIAQYAEALAEATKLRADLKVNYYESEEFITNGFGFKCEFSSLTEVVEKEVQDWSNRIKIICKEAETSLSQALRKNSVVTWFDFPQPVRTSCEQYLLYFVQFLEDLGIEASSEIKEEASKVLFSVTPNDGPTALEQVRQALNIYLRLPGMPDFETSANQHPNLAVQQLQANILHLQSQVILAKASLQAQGATIEMLELSNFQYRQLLSAERKTDNLSEPLLGDAVHLTKIEGKGVMIDLPLILKRLKRAFGIRPTRRK